MKAGLTEIGTDKQNENGEWFLTSTCTNTLSRCKSPSSMICCAQHLCAGIQQYVADESMKYDEKQACPLREVVHIQTTASLCEHSSVQRLWFVSLCLVLFLFSYLFFWAPPVAIGKSIHVHLFRIAKGHWVQWSTRSLELQVVAGPLAPASTVGNTWPVSPSNAARSAIYLFRAYGCFRK